MITELVRGAPWLLLALCACVRSVHLETRENPVEAGLEVPFVADGERRWDFADGTPAVTATQTTHAFAKAGRYVVRSFQGESLREQVTLIVSPRAAFHLVPPDARFAVIARGFEEFPPAVDFGERLAGPQSTQAWLDTSPLLGWAFEQGSAGSSVADAREGLATFAWADAEDTRLSVVGITDGAKALEVLKGWLVERGWISIGAVQGLWRYELEDRSLDVFVDRGALYAVDTPLTHRLPAAQSRIAAASALGLEADGAVATALDQLPSGGLVIFSRAPEAMSWRFATLTVRLSENEARLEGTLHAGAPLWAAPESIEGGRLLTHAPEGPVLVAAASVPPEALAGRALGSLGTQRRKVLDSEMRALGVDLDRAIAAFGGVFELGLYADVPGFVRSTLAAGGRPQPQGTILFEAPVQSPVPVDALVDALGRRWNLEFARTREAQLSLWRGQFAERPVEVALTPKSLFAKAGSALDAREPVDLSQQLAARFDGAFTRGHVSVFLDVGQLRRELLQPRLMPDVDPRRAITAQALAVTLLDQLSALDSALLDVGPAPDGAVVQAVLKLRPRAP